MSALPASLPQTAPALPGQTRNGKLPKILCIDDDPAICQVMQVQLSEYLVEVRAARYGTHGYWEALVHQPDVIITDLRMPQGSGDYVVECLKRNRTTCDIPVIVLTGRDDPALKRYLTALGVKRYFVKPTPFSELCEELKWHIPLEARDDAQDSDEG
jgi:two-component system, OmpR family, response regulator RpaA